MHSTLPLFAEGVIQLRELLANSRQLSSAQAEARRLLEEAARHLKSPRLDPLGLEPLTPEIWELAQRWAHRRMEGQTLQYLTGEQQFYDHHYRMRRGVLVARAETEQLLEVMFNLERSGQLILADSQGYELGVGSGIISLELLLHAPSLLMVGSEICPRARSLSRLNARKLEVDSSRLRLCTAHVREVFEPLARAIDPQTDLMIADGLKDDARPKAWPQKLDFLVMNPPYLSSEDEIDPEVRRNEPSAALWAPAEDPLYYYRRVAQEFHYWAKPQAWVFCELPHERAHAIAELFTDYHIKIYPDLSGRPRILGAQRLG